jgi:hypothetical protein
VVAPALNRSTMSRRVGWARALNTSLAISLTI